MKRFLPITSELSLIREKHRVLLQYLRLVPGHSLACSAALTKKDLHRARTLLADLQGTPLFENERGQVAWQGDREGLRLRFLEKGQILVELTLKGKELTSWHEALATL